MSATTQDTTREIASGREQEQWKQRLDGDEKAPETAFQRWWVRNRAWVLVLTAESFGACMGATARLLEDDEKGAAMHPMQVRCSASFIFLYILICVLLFFSFLFFYLESAFRSEELTNSTSFRSFSSAWH